MGEARRRKKNDPNYGCISRMTWRPKPVSVSIGVSSLTGKFLVMVSILGGQHRVISPHINKADAIEASKEVDIKFNHFSEERWKRYLNGEDNGFWSSLLQSLSYEDDDEILGVLKPGTPEYNAFSEALNGGDAQEFLKSIIDTSLVQDSQTNLEEMKKINNELAQEGKAPMWSAAAIEKLQSQNN